MRSAIDAATAKFVAETVEKLRATTGRKARREILRSLTLGVLEDVAVACGVSREDAKACRSWRALDKLVLDALEVAR